MKPQSLLAFCLMLFCVGCPDQAERRQLHTLSERSTIGGAGGKGAKEGGPHAPEAFVAHQEPAQPGGGDVQAKKGGGKENPPAERKIKYTADLKIICEEFPKAEEAMKATLKKHKAIVAHSEVSASPGAPRGGFWRVRVPVAEFDNFREAVLKLGEQEKNTADSEDLTDEYLRPGKPHIKNKRSEEDSACASCSTRAATSSRISCC